MLNAAPIMSSDGVVAPKEWSFFTNHARVLLCVAHEPELRLRDIANKLDITERTVHGILADLANGGYVSKVRDGRRNRYEIQRHRPLPETSRSQRMIGELLDLLVETNAAVGRRSPGKARKNS